MLRIVITMLFVIAWGAAGSWSIFYYATGEDQVGQVLQWIALSSLAIAGYRIARYTKF